MILFIFYIIYCSETEVPLIALSASYLSISNISELNAFVLSAELMGSSWWYSQHESTQIIPKFSSCWNNSTHSCQPGSCLFRIRDVHTTRITESTGTAWFGTAGIWILIFLFPKIWILPPLVWKCQRVSQELPLPVLLTNISLWNSFRTVGEKENTPTVKTYPKNTCLGQKMKTPQPSAPRSVPFVSKLHSEERQDDLQEKSRMCLREGRKCDSLEAWRSTRSNLSPWMARACQT